MSVLSFQSEPQVQYLYQLVRDIARGDVQLPRFHPFTWTEEQELDLFRSVGTVTPIGSVVLWRTNRQDIAYYDALGPYTLSQPRDRQRTYVIDGHDRLATLFAALHVPPPGAVLPERVAAYSLDTEDFFFAPGDAPPWPAHDPLRPWFPLRFILDFPNLLPLQRSLAARQERELTRRCDRVVNAFSGCKIPVLTIVSNNIDDVTRTFRRISSGGTPLRETDMISALTRSEGFDLDERVASWKEEWLAPLGWGDLDDDAILRVCKAALGFGVGEGNVEAFSRALRASPETLDAAGTAIVGAVRFLRERCGIRAPGLLPHPSYIVPLAEAIRKDPRRAESDSRRALLHWFWAMTYSDATDPVKMLQTLEWMFASPEEKKGSGGPSLPIVSPHLPPLPGRFDLRTARCRALALRLADLAGDEGATLLAEHGERALPHLILDRRSAGERDLASPANRILVRPEDAPGVRVAIERACNEGDRPLLDRHAIPPHAVAALVAKDHARFVELRLRAFEEMENKLARHLGLIPP
jgi:hypothetical protein